MSQTMPDEAACEHFGRDLVALGFWPTADEVARQAADDAFSKHADAG